MNPSHFQYLSLNQFIIPKYPILTSQESWDKLVDLSCSNDDFMLDRFIYRYYSPEQRTKLENLKSMLEKSNSSLHLELIHETSYSGLPYQLHVSCEYENDEKLEIFFDGFIFFITVQKQGSINDLHELARITESGLAFRNDCIKIVNDLFKLNVNKFYSPFWDVEIKDLSCMNLSLVDSEYPAFQLRCNDNGHATYINMGDKIINKIGREYFVYLAKNKQWIRERICHDMIIQNELDNFIKFIKEKNLYAIEANIKFIDSLKLLPSSIFSFCKRNKSWKNLKGIPSNLLNIEQTLPKYEMFVQILNDRVGRRSSYINVPQTFGIKDTKVMNQREVPHLFLLKYEEAPNSKGFSIIDEKSRKPFYAEMYPEINDAVNKLGKNVNTAIKNLNNCTTTYSTNFGFDALWIAIITLWVAIIMPIITTFSEKIMLHLKLIVESVRNFV